MSQNNEKVGAKLFTALLKTHVFNWDNLSRLVQKYAVPFESRPPRLLQEKEAVEAGLLLCVDNKTRNQLINQKTIKFSLTAKRETENLLLYFLFQGSSVADPDPDPPDPHVFWASWIWIH
jgi:hypothetical protein